MLESQIFDTAFVLLYMISTFHKFLSRGEAALWDIYIKECVLLWGCLKEFKSKVSLGSAGKKICPLVRVVVFQAAN